MTRAAGGSVIYLVLIFTLYATEAHARGPMNGNGYVVFTVFVLFNVVFGGPWILGVISRYFNR